MWERVTDRERTGTFRGHYISGFEVSSFVQCGAKSNPEYWWTEFAPNATHPTLDSARAVESRSNAMTTSTHLFLEVHATLSRRGQYGHLGMATRQLTVLAVRQAAPWTDSSCAVAARTRDGQH